MIVGVVKETFPGERRVAMVPGVIGLITRRGAEVIVETGAGLAAGYRDAEYEEKGARIVDRAAVFEQAEVLCAVRCASANPGPGGDQDLERYRRDQVILGLCEPLTEHGPVERLAATGVKAFALELIPRTTRAQSMDVLSSQAMIGGYKAVSLAIDTLPRMLPMMMTAAGTVAPARVFVIGAGVAGLQAISGAKRAGAIVTAFDVRPEVKEQIESLGGKFLEIEVAAASGEGGYAREQTAEEREKQAQAMADAIADSDVLITTAAVPGKKAPMLVAADVVRRMRPGSVIVDMAAERGGNCELSRVDEVVDEGGVTILGPSNMASAVPYTASALYARNVANLLALLIDEGNVKIDMEDDIVAGTLLSEGGEIVHAFAREVFSLPPLAPAGAAADPADADASTD